MMEVPCTPEQETQLSQIPTYAGTPTEEVVKKATLRLVEETRACLKNRRASVRLSVKVSPKPTEASLSTIKARVT